MSRFTELFCVFYFRGVAFPEPPAVDCVWSRWAPWSSCDPCTKTRVSPRKPFRKVCARNSWLLRTRTCNDIIHNPLTWLLLVFPLLRTHPASLAYNFVTRRDVLEEWRSLASLVEWPARVRWETERSVWLMLNVTYRLPVSALIQSSSASQVI